MATSARSSAAETDDLSELAVVRRRLDMAEDELTFLKAVFEEYKDSSGELEAELDAQLKDLERSNVALKRENEQLRQQLQSTVTRSRKSAEEASNLTSALEAHLEELTKREKKAQSRVRQLEQENEELRASGGGGGDAPPAAPAAGAPAASSEEVAALTAEVDKLRAERHSNETAIAELKTLVFDARVLGTKLAALSESRFTANENPVEVPALPAEDVDELASIKADVGYLSEMLAKTDSLMQDTVMSKLLVSEVHAMLQDHSLSEGVQLDGQSERAINKSCIVVLGKIMVLGEALPEFKRAVASLKSSLKEHADKQAEEQDVKEADHLAHNVLVMCADIMTSVFEPMQNRDKKEKELLGMKEDALKKIEEARKEGERLAKQEAEARLTKQQQEAEARISEMANAQSSAGAELMKAKQEVERIRAESESLLQSARTEAKQLAEQARRQALEEAATDRKKIEEEVYESVAGEMDRLKEALEVAEHKFESATLRSQMYQSSMKNAILDQSKAMLQAMKNARDELETLKRGTQSELAATQKLINENLNHVRKVARTIAKSDVATLSMMYERELDMRVKLQDQVQALRGNIRVFCRIRPLLGGEIENGEYEAVSRTDEMTVTAEDVEATDPKPVSFNFDRVFGPEDTQEMVFDEVRTLCLSALDGYNVCLFAYGITGSGKTFTVEGGAGARDNPKLHGLVYRTLKEIFRIALGERAGAYDTTIHVELLELYLDDFNDLLLGPEVKNPPKIEVKISDKGVRVEGTQVIEVKTLDHCMELVKQGYENRTTKATNSNAMSSRSHSILTIYMNGTNVRTKKTYKGKLHFVDLAGSERVKKSGVTGDGAKEAMAINKSLTSLGNVIQALSKKEKHVPYRDSALTKLLQESLGGNSKTVMISNISPCRHSMGETVVSLRFATRVHTVEMGKAQKNEGSEGTAEVRKAKDKMADLEAKFKRGGGAAGKGRTSSTAADGKMKAPTTPRSQKLAKERSPRR